jgi:quinol monooxygenase YgiN
MYARVISAQVDPKQLERLVEIVRDDSLRGSREHRGFRGAYGLVDRSNGRGMLITLWETAEDLEDVEASGYLAHALSQVMGYLHGPAVRETYEVAFEA